MKPLHGAARNRRGRKPQHPHVYPQIGRASTAGGLPESRGRKEASEEPAGNGFFRKEEFEPRTDTASILLKPHCGRKPPMGGMGSLSTKRVEKPWDGRTRTVVPWTTVDVANGRCLCKKYLRRQRKSWQSRRNSQPPLSRRSRLRRRGTQPRKRADPCSAAPRKGEGQPVLGGSEIAALGQVRVCETVPPEGRRGQREQGDESKLPQTNHQGRSAAGGQPAAGSRAGAPTGVVSGAPDHAPQHAIVAPPWKAEQTKAERGQALIRASSGARIAGAAAQKGGGGIACVPLRGFFIHLLDEMKREQILSFQKKCRARM